MRRLLSRPLSIRRGIFQGDSLSPLLFCLSLNHISWEIADTGLGYVCGPAPGVQIHHLWYMDDLKLFAKNQPQLTSLVSVVETMSEDSGMRFNPVQLDSAGAWSTA